MAHYRKIDTRIWNDGKFNALSPDGKLVFLFLLTHPNLTVLGAMRMSAMGVAGELQLPSAQVEAALDELITAQMVQYESEALFIWLPHFLKYNPPESPNVVKSWDNVIQYLPEGKLKTVLMQHAREIVLQLGQGFQDALPELFSQLATEEILDQVNQRCFAETLTVTPPQTPTVTLPLTPGVTPTETPPLTIEHRALSIEHRTVNINQEEIVQKINSEEKNNIGEKENIVAKTRQKNPKPPDAEILWVFEYWQQTLGYLQAQLDPKRRKVIKNALVSGYTVAQLQDAIRGCSLTPHNMGENEQGQRYDGLHVILRDADQIDRFIRNCHNPPKRRTAADQLLADNMAAGERWAARLQQQEEKIINAID